MPLVSRILPSDICRISKKGAAVRQHPHYHLASCTIALFNTLYHVPTICNLLAKYNFSPILVPQVRLDTTLVDFSEMRWERGDITFLYR